MLENVKSVMEIRNARVVREYISLGWNVREIYKTVDGLGSGSYVTYVLTWERDTDPTEPKSDLPW